MKAFYKLFALFALVGVATSCSNQPTATTTEVAVQVSVEDVKPSFIEKIINTTGTLNATGKVTLNTETSGKYKLLNNPKTGRPFSLGDIVEKGQAIIQVEDKEYEIGISIATKKLNLEIAEQNVNKQKSLFEKGGVTETEYKNAQVSYQNSQNDFEKANIQLAKMKVVAPIRGAITDLVAITPGTQVGSGTEVVSLMDYSTMTIDVSLPEKYINEIKVGQPVNIMNYTLPEDTLKGVVKELSPAVSSETRTFKGVISVANPDLKLRPGMFAKADIVLDRHDGVIVIPKEIITSNQRGKSVYVVDNGTAVEKRISLGFETQTHAEVTSGLMENDRLVTKGFETLRNRSKVKIVK